MRSNRRQEQGEWLRTIIKKEKTMNNEILNRIYLNVPIGIKYISDWKDFYLPQGHIIVNKIVTGCGFT